MKEFYLKDIFMSLFKYKWLILFFSFLGMTTSLLAAVFFIHPVYQETAQVLVIPNNEQQTVLQNTEVQANLQLINTYKALIKSPKVLSAVRKEISNKYTIEKLKTMVEPTTEVNSQILNLVTKADSTQEAAFLANVVAEQFVGVTTEVMGSSRLEIISKADENAEKPPIFPKKTNFFILGGGVGFVMGLILVIGMLALSNKVRSELDISESGIPIIGTIGAIGAVKDYPSVRERRRRH
ncbi:TPA: YveK family protein [Enterococcus faecalis]